MVTNRRWNFGSISRRRAMRGGLVTAGGTLAGGFILRTYLSHSSAGPYTRRSAASPGAAHLVAPTRGSSMAGSRLALVYRGPAATPGCPEAVAALIRDSTCDIDVHYVGPKERTQLSAAALSAAKLYAQPGGGDLEDGYRHMRPYAGEIRAYVASGGRYAGFCLGGYLAGATPGFGLLPGDAGQFISTRGASVRTDKDTVVEVTWRNRSRQIYFQDGPYFWTRPKASGVTVLARYTNGRIAAMVAPYGLGRVGVVGPHPEATADWYADYQLTSPDGIDREPGQDLIDTLMRA